VNNNETHHICVGAWHIKTHGKLLNSTGCGKWWGRVVEGIRLIKVHYIYRWDTKVKPHWTINKHQNNKGQECRTGGDKGKVLGEEEGKWRRKRRVNMVELLSIQVWIWNIETCWIHFKMGNRVGWRMMENMTQVRV
jgi:hypothetical protein